jgi:hypothetical protein
MSLEDSLQQRNEKLNDQFFCQKEIKKFSYLRWQSVLQFLRHAYVYGER